MFLRVLEAQQWQKGVERMSIDIPVRSALRTLDWYVYGHSGNSFPSGNMSGRDTQIIPHVIRYFLFHTGPPSYSMVEESKIIYDYKSL